MKDCRSGVGYVAVDGGGGDDDVDDDEVEAMLMMPLVYIAGDWKMSSVLSGRIRTPGGG